MLKRDLSFIEGACALVALLGIGMGVWMETQESIVRVEERLNALDARHIESVHMLTTTHEDFTTSIKELTNVLQELSVSMGRVDVRLGGVEEQLKILGMEADKKGMEYKGSKEV